MEHKFIVNTIVPLLALEGSWAGAGTGTFPTLEPFKYREQLTFRSITNEPYIEYSQIAWETMRGKEQLVHWETGIISVLASGTLKCYACHMNGRIEVYNGIVEVKKEKTKIALESEFIKNEQGLKTATEARRTFIISQGQLTYTMCLATTEVAKLTPHLKAQLKRQETNNP